MTLSTTSATNKPPTSLVFANASAPSTIKTTSARPPQPIIVAPGDRSYAVLRTLGAGASGIVLEALTPRGKNHVAVKIHNAVKKGYERESAIQEAQILKDVQNVPHALQYQGDFDMAFAYYEDADPKHSIRHSSRNQARHAILTEVLPCQDSFKLFLENPASDRTSRLSYAQVMDIGKQALETLQSLHALGYIHRDLKPENMVYDRSTGKLTICDFGTAERVGRAYRGREIGTQYYLAPEVVLLKDYDTSVDMWGLGTTLFELYTGQMLIPTDGSVEDEQRRVDHLRIMVQNIGEDLSPAFIESAPPRVQQLFRKLPNGVVYAIGLETSKTLQPYIASFTKIGKRVPQLPIWQTRIHKATQLKGGLHSHSRDLIDLIGPMLRYENRVSAGAALQRLSASRNPQSSSSTSGSSSALATTSTTSAAVSTTSASLKQ